MTLAPVENRRVRAVASERYPLNKTCSHPECAEPTKDPHHSFRRSAIGGDSWFVELVLDATGELQTIPHVTGLCRLHHDDITEHRAWIKLEDGVWNWYDRKQERDFDGAETAGDFDWALLGPLSPQPGSVEQPAKRKGTAQTGGGEGSEVPLPARPKRVWAVNVPVDHIENGHELLETMTAEAATILDRREHKSFKYYTLIEVLHNFVDTFKGTVQR